MAKLIYPMNVSLDGYMEDEQGQLEWSTVDDETFSFWTEFQRSIGTYLYGRRMYEAMVYWDSQKPHSPNNFTGDGQPDNLLEFAQIFQKADKIVYSRILDKVASERTRLETEFSADAIRELKQSATADLTISGANLAGQALREDLVDECLFLIHPIILGGGKRALPDKLQVRLELVDEWLFASGVVGVRYLIVG